MKQRVNISLGNATITPSEHVEAGSIGCWKLTYSVGESGLKKGGGIMIDTDSDTDWGELQFHDPMGLNYTTITTTGMSTLSWVLEGGFLRQKLKIIVWDQPLVVGDEIHIRIGDQSHGGPGARAQTFAEEKRYFRISVDPRGDGDYIELSTHPYLCIIGGPVERLSVLAPSQVTVGEAFKVVARVLDKYGNPSQNYRGKITLIQEGDIFSLQESGSFGPEDRGVLSVEGLIAIKTGLHRITLEDETGRKTQSNPIICHSKSQDYHLYWGDLHGQVRLAEKIRDYFKFARDVSAVDFASHQRNDHEVSNAHWEETQQIVKEFNDPHKFVTYLGFEWSGQHEVGGDHNIYFLDDDQPIRRSGHEEVEDKSDVNTDLTHINDVYDAYRGKRVLIIPHVGGRPANLTFHDPTLEPVIEVHSTHGTFEWFLRDVLKRGYKVGFVAGSDDYKLRQGGAYPGIGDRRFVRGGLMAVYAKELTRESLFEALKARRCYGTTGERIILEVKANGHIMGEEYTTTDFPEIHVKIAGTKPLDKIEVYRGLEKIYKHPLASSTRPSKTIKITWEGASREWSYSGVMWQGEIRVENSIIRKLSTMPLDRGDEMFSDVSNNGFKWTTFTCGDQDGVTFEVEDEKAKITVICTNTPIVSALGRVCSPMTQVEKISHQFCIKNLGLKPRKIYIGPIRRYISIQRLPEGNTPKEVVFKFLDKEIRGGINPYWVKVTQSDGEMAWSSPIYVNRSLNPI